MLASLSSGRPERTGHPARVEADGLRARIWKITQGKH